MARYRLTAFLLLTTSLVAFSTAQAEDAATKPAGTAIESTAPAKAEKTRNATQLDAVTTTATRNAEALGDVPATVSVIDAEDLERMNARNPRDAIRYEPGVSVGNQPLRTGSSSYTIRGIGARYLRRKCAGLFPGKTTRFSAKDPAESSMSPAFSTRLASGRMTAIFISSVLILQILGKGRFTYVTSK